MKRWLYQILTASAWVVLMGGPSYVHAAFVHTPKHHAVKKHKVLKKKTQEPHEIYLSNDDLPKDGHHYVMVPPPWTPPDSGSTPNAVSPSPTDPSSAVE